MNSIPSWLRERGPFAIAVQRGKIRSPTQRGFDATKWESAVKPSDAPLSDVRLWFSGIWFAAKLAAMRQYLSSRPRPKLDAAARTRILVGLMNHRLDQFEKLYAERMESRTTGRAWNEFGRFEVDDQGIEDSLVGLVDGLRYALADDSESGAPYASSRDVAMIINDFEIRATAGQQYDLLESLWASCQWMGWFVESHDDFYVVRPQDEVFERGAAVGRFRTTRLQFEFAISARGQWATLPLAARISEAARPTVSHVRREGRGRRILWNTGSFDDPDSIDFRNVEVFDPYIAPLLHEPVAQLGNLSIAQLLDAWRFLSPLGKYLSESSARSDGIRSIQQAKSYAQLVSRAEIARALSGALGFTVEQAEATIRILSFSSDVRQDLWARPIIPVDATHVGFLRAVLEHSNPSRLAGRWIRDFGLDTSSRGLAWEKQIRDDLCIAAKNLSTADVYAESFEPSDTSIGDVDVLFRVGPTLVIAELKCSLLPVEPLERARYFELLASAAAQARRKAEWIRENLSEVERVTGWALGNAPIVTSCVVSNVATGTGFHFHEVPVIDEFILLRFFDLGYYRKRVRVSAGQQEVLEAVPFYSSPENAAVRFAGYIARPPQLEGLLEDVVFQPQAILTVDESDRRALFVKAVVNRPLIDEIKKESP